MATTALCQRGANLKRLNDRQRRFVAEYLLTMNGTDAARRAGYKHPTAIAGRLLKQKVIAAAIGKRQREDLERLGLDRDRILLELACLALRDPIDLVDPETGLICVDDLRKIPERIRRCIDSIRCKQVTDDNGNTTQEIELKLTPKTAAVELALRHFGLMKDKQEVVTYHTIDWDALSQGPVPDTAEERLALEEDNETIEDTPTDS